VKVLVACEFSGVVRDAFASRGHDAWSCDLLPTERPGNHIQGDVLDILEDGWDLMIAHPPCTYLCSSGLHWNKRVPGRDELTHEAMLFVLNLMGEGFIDNPIPRIALENPIGRIGTAYRKADQIIHPHQFGHDASKSTCLWLKNLPLLEPTKHILPGYGCPTCKIRFDYGLGKYGCPDCHGEPKPAKQIWGNQTPGGQNKLGPSEDRWKERSVTYQGIADAMADQWWSLK
jgi:hypothetical protein